MKKEDLINAVVRTLYDEQMHLHTKDRGMVILYLYQLAGGKELIAEIINQNDFIDYAYRFGCQSRLYLISEKEPALELHHVLARWYEYIHTQKENTLSQIAQWVQELNSAKTS